jgi:hypothetical protein
MKLIFGLLILLLGSSCSKNEDPTPDEGGSKVVFHGQILSSATEFLLQKNIYWLETTESEELLAPPSYTFILFLTTHAGYIQISAHSDKQSPCVQNRSLIEAEQMELRNALLKMQVCEYIPAPNEPIPLSYPTDTFNLNYCYYGYCQNMTLSDSDFLYFTKYNCRPADYDLVNAKISTWAKELASLCR